MTYLIENKLFTIFTVTNTKSQKLNLVCLTNTDSSHHCVEWGHICFPRIGPISNQCAL